MTQLRSHGRDGQVRLVLDQMLPRFIASELDDLFEDVAHVKDWQAEEEDDAAIFASARERGYTIVTKDADYQSLLGVHGAPPRIVWLRIGNTTREGLRATLLYHAVRIREFHRGEGDCLIIDQAQR